MFKLAHDEIINSQKLMCNILPVRQRHVLAVTEKCKFKTLNKLQQTHFTLTKHQRCYKMYKMNETQN